MGVKSLKLADDFQQSLSRYSRDEIPVCPKPASRTVANQMGDSVRIADPTGGRA